MDAFKTALPHLTALLNAVATVLLLVGLRLIRQGRVTAHRNVMIGCFGVSVLFLITYLARNWIAGDRPFPKEIVDPIRIGYFSILISHVFLALFVPFLALGTLYLGLRDRRAAHRRLARWTFPIWLYVSVTGVVVYLMLYWGADVFPRKIPLGL